MLVRIYNPCRRKPNIFVYKILVSNSGQYLYDANANMTYDPSKKITVSYNHLNLPSLVEFDNSDFIEYTYTTTGTKLRKPVTSWKTTGGGKTDYAGQFLYQDNELSCIFTPVGRIVPMQYNDETFWKHEYNLKDHLGNTHIVFAAHPHGQPEVMQQTSYYPFGMTLQQQNFGGALNQPNKLLYNGKELQDDELAGVCLDWYDYGARMYDAQIGRWHVVDPMADIEPGWSPYRYGFNNPIYYTDPTGMIEAQLDFFDGYTVDDYGNIKFEEKTDDDFDVLYTKESWDKGTKDNSITVDKGVLSSKKTLSITDAGTGDKFKLDRYKITGDDKARSLYEFVAKNTNVEWGLTGIGTKNTNMLTTIHDKDSEAGGPFFLANSYTIRYYDHSHPYHIYPSDADMSFAKNLNLKFPKAKLQILHEGSYNQYDKLGLLTFPGSFPEVIIPGKKDSTK
jgi:RHS repeat-associated protein